MDYHGELPLKKSLVLLEHGDNICFVKEDEGGERAEHIVLKHGGGG